MVLNRLLFNPSDICGRYYGPDIRNFRFGSNFTVDRPLSGAGKGSLPGTEEKRTSV
jgi:hypothetical protein